jgi:hypothetical protein
LKESGFFGAGCIRIQGKEKIGELFTKTFRPEILVKKNFCFFGGKAQSHAGRQTAESFFAPCKVRRLGFGSGHGKPPLAMAVKGTGPLSGTPWGYA